MKEIKFHEQSEGWTVEYSRDGDVAHISRPNEIGGGFVSINLVSRCFSCGYCWPSRAWDAKRYVGRGWMDAIVADAVAQLAAV